MIFGKHASIRFGSNWVLVSLLLGIVAALTCSPRAATLPPDSSIALSRIPDLGLGPTDDIDAVDFQVDRNGVLHVAWRAVIKKPASSGATYKVLYARGEGGGTTWSPPVEIESRLGKPPRIVLTPGRIHIVQENDLRHFVSEDDGRTWKELASHLQVGGGKAVGLDVLSLGEALLLTYLVRPAGSGNAGLNLHVAHWSPTADKWSSRITTFPGSNFQQPAPRLASEGARLHLLCGLNAENRRTVTSGGTSAEEFVVSGRLLYLRSEDGGATWSTPVEVVPGETAPAEIKTLQSVELLPFQGRIHALFSAFGLYMSHSDDGRRWSVPVPVAPYEVSISEGTHESGSVSAAAAAGRGYVAWIDARYRRSDRRWWNPLGGVPWSDESPFRTNNDVFLLPWAELEALSGPRPGRADRLTPPDTFVRSLRVRVGGPDRLFLLWAGRRAIKKPNASSDRPEIAFTMVPIVPRPKR